MKDRTKSIVKLRLEIEALEEDIVRAHQVKKRAFAQRLEKIKQLKSNKLRLWLRF